jgi:hypothetical protein
MGQVDRSSHDGRGATNHRKRGEKYRSLFPHEHDALECSSKSQMLSRQTWGPLKYIVSPLVEGPL